MEKHEEAIAGQVDAFTELRELRELQARKKYDTMVFKVLNAAMDALSKKALLLVSLIASVGLFVWAVYDPTSPRIVAACLFSLFVFLPILISDRTEKENG